MANSFFRAAPTTVDAGFVDLLENGYKPLRVANTQGSGDFVDLLSDDYQVRDVNPDVGDFDAIDMVKNIPSSAGNLVKDTATGIYNMVRHPIDTANAIGDVGRSYYNKAQQEYGFQKFGDEDTSDTRIADNLNEKLDQSYGTLGRAARTFQEKPVEQVANLAGILAGGGMATGIKGMTKAGAAIDPIGMGMTGIRKMAGKIAPATGGVNVVKDIIRSDIKNSNMSIDDVAGELAKMGKNSTLGDVSPHLRSRTESVANSSATGRAQADIYTERGKASGLRIGDVVDGLFEGDRLSLDNVVEDISKSVKLEAAPLYNKAYEKTIDVTPELSKLMDTPDVRKAYKIAQRLAANEGVKLPKDLLESVPSMQTWDYIKRGLDQTISKAGSGVFGETNTLGRNIQGLKSRLLSNLDQQNPDYAKARKIYASGADNKKAAKLGQKFLDGKITDRQITKMLEGFSLGESEAYKLGAMQRIYDDAKKTKDSGNVYAKLFGDNNMRDKIKAVLQDDAAFKILEESIKTENAFNQTHVAALLGSQTARRQAGSAELAGVLQQANRTGMIDAIGTKAFAMTQTKTKAQMEELGNLLMTKDIDLKKALVNEKIKPSAVIGGHSAYQSGKVDADEILRLKRLRLKKLAEGMM